MTRRTSVSDFTVAIGAMVDRLDTGKPGDTSSAALSAAASALKLDQLQFLSDIFKTFFSRAFYEAPLPKPLTPLGTLYRGHGSGGVFVLAHGPHANGSPAPIAAASSASLHADMWSDFQQAAYQP
jgi:hypothetical protein